MLCKTRTTALRMFLRYLIAEGQCASGLAGAVPVFAYWRLSSLPLSHEVGKASLNSTSASRAPLCICRFRTCTRDHNALLPANTNKLGDPSDTSGWPVH